MARRLAARVASDAGFTLMEIMIVMALIVTLASVGLGVYGNSVTRAKEATLKEDLFRMRDAIDQYYADKGKYPADLNELVAAGYMRRLPEDPMTQKNDSWQVVPAEPDPNNPSNEPGIYNVTSGSEGLALDGTKYSDW